MLNGCAINFVIFFVSAYKTNKNSTQREFYHNYQPEIISLDIKNISLISNTVYAIKISLNITKIFPFGVFCISTKRSYFLMICGFGTIT